MAGVLSAPAWPPLLEPCVSWGALASLTKCPRGRYNEVNAISTACSSGVQECKKLVSDLFSKWMADPNNNP